MEYSIRQVSEMVGLSIFTLRYYDKEGLLPFVKRTASGTRVFKDKDIEWLNLICCLKNIGMSIENIKEFMDICLSDEDLSETKREILIKQRKKVLSQIEDLKASLKKIDYKIEHYKEIGVSCAGSWEED